jgi:putative ABC transport system permease protein
MNTLRYAFRLLWKSPGFTLTALLTLALGIGATTAMFSIIDSVLLRPLPFKDSDRLVRVWKRDGNSGYFDVSAPDVIDWRERATCFESVTATQEQRLALQSGSEASSLYGRKVLTNFFEVIGAKPVLGRVFRSVATTPAPEVVVSEKAWRSLFASNPQVIGRRVILNGIEHEIIGVMPKDFVPEDRAVDCWVPYAFTQSDLEHRDIAGWLVTARLKNSFSILEAQARVDAVMEQIHKENPSEPDYRSHLNALKTELVGASQHDLLLLLSAVCCLTLMICVNLGNLILGRNFARQRELSIRAALGASRTQLIAHSLAETSLLGLLGGVMGWLAANWILDLFLYAVGSFLPRASEVSLNGFAFIFATVLAVLMGLFTGLLPARVVTKRIADDLQEALRQKTGIGGRARGSLQKTLVLVQVACSVALLSCTGLLFHSFLVLRNANTGMARPEKVLTARLDLSPNSYPKDQDVVDFTARLQQNLERQPGVEAAGLINHTPLGHINNPVTAVPSSMSAVPQDQRKLAEYRVVAGNYFSAAGIPLIAGRLLDGRDDQVDDVHVVVNRQFVAQFWRDPQEAIGQKILILNGAGTIVGVTGDIRQVDLEKKPTPEIDFSFSTALRWAESVKIRLAGQMIDPTATVILRGKSSLPGEDLVAAVRNAVRMTDAALPVTEIKTVENLMDDNVSYRKFIVELFGGFAIGALLLATLGLYGVISYMVTQRTREIGMRIALGAQRSHILKLVTGSGMRLIFLGLILGIGSVLCLSRLVNGFLYEITAADPVTILATAALVSTVALLAHLIPLRRAMKIDPIVALREE